MKEDITNLAVSIHIYFMEQKKYYCPDFDDLFEIARDHHHISTPLDLRIVSFAIDQAFEQWDSWTSEYHREGQEAKSQAKWEDANRGEI